MKTSLQALLAGAAAALTGLGLVVAVPVGAQATTYQLDFVPTQGIVSPFGTVDITGGGSSITYAFNLTSGGQFHSAGQLDTLVFDLNGTVSTVTTSGGGGFTLGTLDTSPKADGLGTFTDGFSCTNPSSPGNACGTSFSVTFTGSNLSAGFTLTQGLEIFAGADVTCVANAAGTSTCPNDPSFTTGMVGATPLPGALALFLGPMMFGGGYLLRRRRRTTPAAA